VWRTFGNAHHVGIQLVQHVVCLKCSDPTIGSNLELVTPGPTLSIASRAYQLQVRDGFLVNSFVEVLTVVPREAHANTVMQVQLRAVSNKIGHR